MSMLGHLVTVAITGAIVGAILKQAISKAPSFEPETGTATLRYGRWIHWLLAACLLLAGFGLWAAIFVPKSRAGALTLAVLFGAGALFIVRERRTSIVVDAAGIEAKTGWRGPRRLAWKDVVAIDYSSLAAALVLRGRDGTAIRVSAYLTGIGTLRSILIESFPPSVVAMAIERFDRQRAARS